MCFVNFQCTVPVPFPELIPDHLNLLPFYFYSHYFKNLFSYRSPKILSIIISIAQLHQNSENRDNPTGGILTNTHLPLMHMVSFSKENSDRKSSRLNSSHVAISYAVFC